MQKLLHFSILCAFVFALSGCRNAAPAAPITVPAKSPVAVSGPSVLLATEYPTSDRLVLAWSLTGAQKATIKFSGQALSVTSPLGQIKVKVTLEKSSMPDQVEVFLETTESPDGSDKTSTKIRVAGIPNGDDGKPLPIGSLMTPTVRDAVPLEMDSEIELAKGVSSFPGLSVKAGKFK